MDNTMKKINYYQICMILFLTFLVVGCTDIMDKRDLRNVSAEDVWGDPTFVKGFIDYTMNSMPGEEHHTFYQTDEAYSQYNVAMVQDLYSVDNAGPEIDNWQYSNIRNINKFLDNMDKIPRDKVTDAILEQYVGQMKVLRAWHYFQMVRAYGGVPLILHEQKLDEELSVPRSKTSECMAAIVQDLNDAIALESFPMKWTGNDAGRISKAVAYALKGRILLTYASPQFSSTIGAGTKSAEQRWTEAYNACKDAKDKLAEAGYGLFRPNPASPAEAIQNYYDMFIGNEMNEEMVWVRRYAPQTLKNSFDRNIRPGCSGGPTSEGGLPNLEMVNDFARADGTPYTDLVVPNISNGNNVVIEESKVAFWKSREPRFYAYIAYNGCEWPLIRSQQQSVPSYEIANNKMKHQWIFELAQFPYEGSEDQYGGGSGFRFRKMVDVSMDFNNVVSQGNNDNICGTDWPLIRYAEVLLNFAETAVKTGHESEAVQILRDIRKRAGIPAGDGNYGLHSSQLSGNSLIAAILNERRIEFLIEGMRIFDLRRWRLYTDDLVPGATTIREGKKLNGMFRHILKAELIDMDPRNPDHEVLANLNINDEDTYFSLFKHTIRARDIPNAPISFTERLYFLRIPYVAHIQTNPVIEQTKGWTDVRGPGTFDPYE
jgi:hypothetical protein